VPAPPVLRDIRNVFDRVRKNVGDETLHDPNLKPYKDSVCLIGNVADGAVHTSYPPDRARDYVSFICQGNDNRDGDVVFNLIPDGLLLDDIPNFWAEGTGWLHDPNNIKAKLEDFNQFHCELIMFGRTGGCDNGGSHYDPVLLPGWQEQEGNSVLFNGRPLNGEVEVNPIRPDPNDHDKWTVDRLAGLSLPAGSRVRVTGPIVLDCGHANWLGLHECYDDDRSEHNHEIHPVYALDVLNPTPLDDVTGYGRSAMVGPVTSANWARRCGGYGCVPSAIAPMQ
jgi:hypothetical protein